VNQLFDPAGLEAEPVAGGTYRSTKTYDHSEGLSCTFRQWRAGESHCRLLHGYALAFKFVFVALALDERHWCLDFGGLKPVRQWLHEMFDHTLLVAADDPERAHLEALGRLGLADVRLMPAVGCEATARFVHGKVGEMVFQATGGRVRLESVEVREHGGNSASYGLD
jgi:6-pyruvoyltetrahydropterin/6-carboxytetrahydropterin synthase